MTLQFKAMTYAKDMHEGQLRKYTHNPYFDHLAEVVGIVSSVDTSQVTLATAWLHDTIEDTAATLQDIEARFGSAIVEGVFMLSDLEEGSRATRKALARERLSEAPAWIQNIKCADIISNSSSILTHDANFAKVYLKEQELLLQVLTKADEELKQLAWRSIRND